MAVAAEFIGVDLDDRGARFGQAVGVVVVQMSPTITAQRRSGMMRARVFCRVVVLPEPGELIMLSTKTLCAAKWVRMRSAMMSLASSTRRTTLISRLPDLRVSTLWPWSWW